MKPPRRLNRALKAGLGLFCLAALVSCRTLQYREVQSDFERAVAAETARAESPFIDWYQGVADTLTDDYIAKLDDKLRPNAWMLRGMSEWRSGRYSDAHASAARGLQEIDRQRSVTPRLAGSRDDIVLTLLPGLVQDSQLRDKLQAAGNNLTAATYQASFLPQFKAVLTQFEEAKRKFAAPSPQAVKHYWSFQLWRVLQNWLFTLGALPVGEEETKAALADADTIIAQQFSQLTGAVNLRGAIIAAKESIPADHPYRRLIEFEEKAASQPR